MVEEFGEIEKEILIDYKGDIFRLIDTAYAAISTISPSEFAEQYRVMGGNTGVAGQFSFENAPYAREIVDTCAPDHPSRKIAVMKGVQIGLSTSGLQNILIYTMVENPCNMMLLVGHEDLIKDSTERIDDVIKSVGADKLLRSNSGKSNKSGNTDTKKEFQDGYLTIGTANHKTLRQVSIKMMIADDMDAMKQSSKGAGHTVTMIDARTKAFKNDKKIYYVSSPELKESSLIEPLYLQGDQRRYHVPCPCCDELIILEWDVVSELDPKQKAGITWQTTPDGLLIDDSVGYTCQKCGGFFDDSNKTEMLREEGRGGKAKWIPTAVPADPTFYSYHVSTLYAPIYMDGWLEYVREYIVANPHGQPRDEKLHQAWVNLCLGLTYEPTGESISATQLQENIRPYEIGTIPEKMSIADGNGKIVMLTCGSDLGGKVDDARLDYEVVAHAENGATYSITHGSIGTFINKDKHPERREHFTYMHGIKNNVWDLFDNIITANYFRDTDGSPMQIAITGVDTGYFTNYAYDFVDKYGANVVGLKGDEYEKPTIIGTSRPTFRQSTEKGSLYLVESNHTKDQLSELIQLRWIENMSTVQPGGFMNFPTPSGGKYLYKNFFQHYEAEEKILDKGKFVWKKKSQHLQNHLFDCRLYALVVKDIILAKVLKDLKIKNGVWQDFVNYLNSVK